MLNQPPYSILLLWATCEGSESSRRLLSKFRSWEDLCSRSTASFSFPMASALSLESLPLPIKNPAPEVRGVTNCSGLRTEDDREARLSCGGLGLITCVREWFQRRLDHGKGDASGYYCGSEVTAIDGQNELQNHHEGLRMRT